MSFVLLLTLALLVVAPFPWNGGGLRRRILRAAILLGVLVVVLTESLSLLHALTFWGLTAAWGGVLVTLGIWTFQHGGLKQTVIALPAHKLDRWLLAGVAVVIVATGLVAILAPVQTPDSLSYHMSRVAHWAQNGSVAHFATGIERQLFMSPLTEYFLLHVFVLGRGDGLINLPNWLVFIGLATAASWLACQFGAGTTGQILAALFSVSVPIAIAQASSTTTDLMAAFWVTCLAVEVLALVRSTGERSSTVFAGLATGLAVLTKPTGDIFAVPFLVWAAWLVLRRDGWRRALGLTLVTIAAVLLLNAGIFSRNLSLYGNPLGPVAVIQYQSNQIYSFNVLVSNLTRNLAVHLGSIGPLNRLVMKAVEGIHRVIGLDSSDPRTSLTSPFVVMAPRNEDIIGNLVPLLLFLAACLGWLFRRKDRPADAGWFALCLWAGFVIFSLTNRWQLFATRLQLPFFMLAAPFSAVIMIRLLPRSWISLLAGLVFVSALPWTFSLFTRPILPIPGWTDSQRILNSDRTASMFRSVGVDQDYYQEVAAEIRAAGCRDVQLVLKGDDPEYLWWKVLHGGLDRSLDIEWRVSDTPSAALAKPDFIPCAAIMDDRVPSGEFPGLTMAGEHNGIYFFLKKP
jgi:hypothetical protein